MATHSSILAWRIPWMEEPGGLLSMESQRVGHNLATKQRCVCVCVCVCVIPQPFKKPLWPPGEAWDVGVEVLEGSGEGIRALW